MRKIFYLFALALLFAGGCDARKENAPVLADDKIYFFYYNECPYCHDAMDYMNAEYPRLKVTMVNIQSRRLRTAAEMRRKIQTRPQCRHAAVLHGRPLPDGLVGRKPAAI